jgi:RimJ/RimL family protein N-acetyltransferase
MKKKSIQNLKLDGNNFYLRSLKLSDINNKYLSWINDKKINQYLYNPNKKYSKNDLIKYFKEIDFNKKMVFAIIDKKNTKHVGNMGLNPIDIKNQKTGIGGIIGDKKYWGSTAFVEGLQLLIDYSFKVRKFIRVYSGVHENNVPGIIASKKAGFKLEGIFKNNIIINNVSCGTYNFGITNKKNEKYHFGNKKNLFKNS